jgi:hypothetical protein
VKEENDATKALEAALEFNPDLILLDMVMPKIDGGRVAAQLRSKCRNLWNPHHFSDRLHFERREMGYPRNQWVPGTFETDWGQRFAGGNRRAVGRSGGRWLTGTKKSPTIADRAAEAEDLKRKLVRGS